MAGSLKRLSTLLVGVLVAAALGNSTSSAADVCGAASVIDADTIKVEGRRFRLDGIDAPATDQSCLEAGGAKWSCGIEARDELSAYIKGRSVCCNDIGPDANYRSHRIGRCRIGKENLSKWLVNQGWALDFNQLHGDAIKSTNARLSWISAGCGKGVLLRLWISGVGIGTRRSSLDQGVPAMRATSVTSYSPLIPIRRRDVRTLSKAKFAHFWSG